MINVFEEYQNWKQEKQVKETGILGFCACCGATHHIDKPYLHDENCVYYENQKAK